MLKMGAPLTDSALLQKIVLGAGTMAIVSVGAWTANTLTDLTTEVNQLRLTMATLAAKVDGMPPKDLLLRVTLLEDETNRLNIRLNTIASRVHKKLGIEE